MASSKTPNFCDFEVTLRLRVDLNKNNPPDQWDWNDLVDPGIGEDVRPLKVEVLGPPSKDS